MTRSRILLASILCVALQACATHRLDGVKAHYLRGVELAGRMDRAAAAAEFTAARDEATRITGGGAAAAQAQLVKGQAELELGDFESARVSFAAARGGGLDAEAGWERVAVLLGMASVYEEMRMPREAAGLCESAMADARKLGSATFEIVCARWVDLMLGFGLESADDKARGKLLEGIDKKVRGLVDDNPTSGTLRYLVSQIDMHLGLYGDAWRSAVLARELGLPTEEILRDNDQSLLFCYRMLVEAGSREYVTWQEGWARRWNWRDATHPDWEEEK